MAEESDNVAITERLDIPPSIVKPWQWGVSISLVGVVGYLLIWSVVGLVPRKLHFSGIVKSGSEPISIEAYLSPALSQQVVIGQETLIYFSSFNGEAIKRGRVIQTSQFPRRGKQLGVGSLLKSDDLYYSATITPESSMTAAAGTLVHIAVIIDRERPLFVLFPSLKQIFP